MNLTEIAMFTTGVVIICAVLFIAAVFYIIHSLLSSKLKKKLEHEYVPKYGR